MTALTWLEPVTLTVSGLVVGWAVVRVGARLVRLWDRR